MHSACRQRLIVLQNDPLALRGAQCGYARALRGQSVQQAELRGLMSQSDDEQVLERRKQKQQGAKTLRNGARWGGPGGRPLPIGRAASPERRRHPATSSRRAPPAGERGAAGGRGRAGRGGGGAAGRGGGSALPAGLGRAPSAPRGRTTPVRRAAAPAPSRGAVPAAGLGGGGT